MPEELETEKQKTSSDYCPGSQKWHFAIANELDEQAKTETDKEQATYIRERAEFHRLVGQHQK